MARTKTRDEIAAHIAARRPIGMAAAARDQAHAEAAARWEAAQAAGQAPPPEPKLDAGYRDDGLDALRGTPPPKPKPEPRACACGCGGQTQSTWVSGHDALQHANPRCFGCSSRRIPSTRPWGAFCSWRCATTWAVAHTPAIEWSVPLQAWLPDATTEITGRLQAIADALGVDQAVA